MTLSQPEKAELCPAQQRAIRELADAIDRGGACVLWSGAGLGKTTILRELHRRVGGTLLGAREILDAMSDRHPFSIEEAFFKGMATRSSSGPSKTRHR